ncbi:MAG: DUF2306 domain-containing protein [Sphingorhabdus sp.]
MRMQTRPSALGLNLIWIIFALGIAFYAFMAMEAGKHTLPSSYDESYVAIYDSVEAKGNAGVPYADVAEETQQAYPYWNNFMAGITGTYFGFGSNGTTDPTRYYASMTDPQKSVLSLHMFLGGACIILGIFQFWPGFRKSYRKAHRAIGGTYILAAYTMIFASIYHLLHTGVADTFQGFTFYIQLWFLVISTLVTQTLAIYFIKKRNFALHFGFQLYTFVAFINAPIQRLDWIIFGSIYPHLTHGEVNNLVNILTFWQSLLVGYLIFAWNRAASPVRSKPIAIIPPSRPLSVAVTVLTAMGVISAVAQYMIFPGLGSWSVASSIVPASTLAADLALFNGKTLQNIIFTAALCTAMVSGVWLMIRDEKSAHARNAFYSSSLLAGAFQIYWGLQLGEPSMAVTSGGGFYLVSGISMIAFPSIALLFQYLGREHLWHEVMVFASNFAFAPVILLWMHALWYVLDVIPPQYLDVGHGYILAAGGAILGPTFTGFFLLFNSRETRSRQIS